MLDQYRLLEPIGEGGMGVVWKARDTTLDRDVAIKVLPAEFVRDADRLARFEREAKAVAALSHPNIVAIHGFGQHDGTAYAAIELLEGRSLREHLDEGSLPPRKTLDVARQIATGLDAAHAKGIVHRDLKPDNVFLSSDSRARILDFGLAAVGAGDEGKRSDPSAATRTELTTPGSVMGTVSYMSPEQVRGAAADSRSDIFSLGTMLHEMFSGRRTFDRPTTAETMTAILREDAEELTVGGQPAPATVKRIVERCLEKSPDERFQSARDLAFALDSATFDSSSTSVTAVAAIADRPRRTRLGLPVVVGALVLVAAAAFVVGRIGGAATEAAPIPRITPLTFSGEDLQPSVSPDGKLIAFTSSRDGTSRIWLRQVETGGEQPLTEGPDWRPRFSPDGSSVTFIRGVGDRYSAYRVPLVGGQPRKLLDDVNEIVSSPDGRRFAYLQGSSVASSLSDSRVGLLDPETGEKTILHQVSGYELFGLCWSPDGGRLSLTRASVQGAAGNWLALLIDVETAEVEEIAAGGDGLISSVTWAGSSALILASSPTTVSGTARPYLVLRHDLETGESRELFWASYLFPFRGSLNNTTQIELLDDHSVVFDTFRGYQRLFEITLDGETIRPLLGGTANDRQPAYHPDGSRVLFTSNRSGNVDLFSYEFATGQLLQLTDHPGADWDGGYTPDGKSIIWGSDRGGPLEIWTADADGSNPRQVSQTGSNAENPTMTPDGKWIVFASGNADASGIYRMNADGSEMINLVPGNWTNAEVSPDGRFAFYLTSDGSQLRNIMQVVEVATGETVPFRIEQKYNVRSRNVTYLRGRWTPDGSSIVFVGIDDDGNTGLYIQDFDPQRDTIATRRKLVGFRGQQVHESFGISPDGKRIVLATVEQERTLNLADRLSSLR